MKYNVKMDQKQSQRPYLSEAMRQGIEILQMNSQELELLIEAEVSENPVLEMEYPENIDWQRYAREISYRATIGERESYDSQINPDNFIEKPITLYEHMKNEISYLGLDSGEKAIAYYIVDNVNEKGYFISELQESLRSTNTTEEKFMEVLHKVQSMEPLGLAARNLRECLLLQLQKEKGNELLCRIVQEDLETLAQKKYSKLQKKYGISNEKIRSVEQTIRGLNPTPGNIFSSDETIYIIPDLVLEVFEDHLEIISNSLYPRLTISEFYRKLLLETEDKEARDFVQEKLDKAVQLIQSIDRRKNTLQRVSEHIVEYQKDFFTKGNSSIVPMRLKDIALLAGYHESTVSRAIRGKYILTPRGLFELKSLFTSPLNTLAGGTVSDYFVKERILQLIMGENKSRPMSDQRICEQLNAQGILIARRTVAKYREELRLPCASRRKATQDNSEKATDARKKSPLE